MELGPLSPHPISMPGKTIPPYVAIVAIIYATAPFLAGVRECMVLSERIRRVTMAAAGSVFGRDQRAAQEDRSMHEDFLIEVNDFFGRAAAATYAGSGPRVASERGGFQELVFEDGDWSYRDSYTGYIRSRGQEIIRYRGDPVWAQSYGGGMEGRFARDRDLSDRNMAFLKTALSSGDKRTRFQPRGPCELVHGDWSYVAEWVGDIVEFRGAEEIQHQGELVFTHKFIGGLIEP